MNSFAITFAVVCLALQGSKSNSQTTTNQCEIEVDKSNGANDTDGVPTTFTYVCNLDGSITIDKKTFYSHGKFKITGIQPSPKVKPEHCNNFSCTNETDQITVTGCKHDTPVLLDFDKLSNVTQNNGVIGGHSSKRFKLDCSSAFTATISYAMIPSTLSSSYTTPAVKYDLPQITMHLTQPGQTTDVQTAVVGEKLSLGILITETTYKIKATLCEATSDTTPIAKKIKLWDEQSKSADTEIFGSWKRTDNQNISASIYAFRFVGTDNVYITCNVRLCFIGGQLDKECNEISKSTRKRRSYPEQVKHESVTTKIRVYDVQQSNNSGQNNFTKTVAMVTWLVFIGSRILL